MEKSYTCALMFYQRAEQHFYTQIMGGDIYAQKDLDFVIKIQNKIRKLITKELPPLNWKNKEE